MEHDEDRALMRFIVEHVETVPHLEALLLTWQNPGTGWTADELARRLYVPLSVARAVLEDLLRQGALRRESGDDGVYRFEPDWDAERRLLPRLAELYRRQLVSVTKLIHSKGSTSVREFARAFELKKNPPRDP